MRQTLDKYKFLLGLIGFPLTHSFSKTYFLDKFYTENLKGYYYENFPLDRIEAFTYLIRDHNNLRGLNVTIPYKESIIGLLDSLDNVASSINAVNVIKKVDNQLLGYNTDAFGFEFSIKPLLQKSDKKALVLGTGGASKAVTFTLSKIGLEYLYISRTPRCGQISYQDINPYILNEYRVIINTTPLGMSPAIETCPDIPYDLITKKHLLYDLVYNPSETLFLKKGKLNGARIKNGHEMLILQAQKSWKIWHNNE